MNYRELKKLVKIMKSSKNSNRQVKMAKKIHQRMSSSNSNRRNSISNSVSSIEKKLTSFLSPTKDIIEVFFYSCFCYYCFFDQQVVVPKFSSQNPFYANMRFLPFFLYVQLKKINTGIVEKESINTGYAIVFPRR